MAFITIPNRRRRYEWSCLFAISTLFMVSCDIKIGWTSLIVIVQATSDPSNIKEKKTVRVGTSDIGSVLRGGEQSSASTSPILPAKLHKNNSIKDQNTKDSSFLQTISNKNSDSNTAEREMCGYDPPENYCGFCDAYYKANTGVKEYWLVESEGTPGTCGDGDTTCVKQCSYAPSCTSDPDDYCEGYCCKDFQCRLLLGCKYECAYNAVGCDGICCENRDEVSKDFWDKAADKGAQWFMKRAAKFVLGGCGLFCDAFIQFLFAPRKPGLLMSMDCWKLDNQEVEARTMTRDPDYPFLDDSLLTSDLIQNAFDDRKMDYNDYYNKDIETPTLMTAFVMKVKVPSTHNEFITAGKDGGVYWLEEWVKNLYDEFSGCNDCCKCAINGMETCLYECAKNVKLSFNYNIQNYTWPDWEWNHTLWSNNKYSPSKWSRQIPNGFYYNNSLLFHKLDFSNFMGAINTFPLETKDEYDGVLLGCHVYPSPGEDPADPNTSARRTFAILLHVVVHSVVCISMLYLF